jgi:hypothetical protein
MTGKTDPGAQVDITTDTVLALSTGNVGINGDANAIIRYRGKFMTKDKRLD